MSSIEPSHEATENGSTSEAPVPTVMDDVFAANDETLAPSDEPPPQHGAAPPPRPILDLPSTEVPPEAVSYEEIREACWLARQRKQTIVAVLGLPASGKTFFIDRLHHSMVQTHSRTALKGMPRGARDDINRTQTILLTSLRPTATPDSRGAIHLVDIPGDFIAPLVRKGFGAESDVYQQLNAILLVLSLSDSLVFVAPALQVLNRELYITEGDDENLASGKSLTETDRNARVADLESFINSLYHLRSLLQPLRETLSSTSRQMRHKKVSGDPKALLDRSITRILDTPQLVRPAIRNRPLRLPLILLLSRADELKRRGGDAVRNTFDADPAWQVDQCHPAYFNHLAGFEFYCIDFLTAQKGENPTRVNPDIRGFGIDGVFRGWFARVIADSRRPLWLNFLRSPRIATSIRRTLDPTFPRIR